MHQTPHPPLPSPNPPAQVRLKEYEGALREYKRENAKFFEAKERYKATIAGLEKEVQVGGRRCRGWAGPKGWGFCCFLSLEGLLAGTKKKKKKTAHAPPTFLPAAASQPTASSVPLSPTRLPRFSPPPPLIALTHVPPRPLPLASPCHPRRTRSGRRRS